MKLAVPWYVHPVQTARWRWMRSSTVELAVINVSDGPGAGPDQQYIDVLSGLFSPTLVGYVDISYGLRSLPDVLRDVENWAAWYGVRNIFLDQVPTDPKQGNWDIDWLTKLRRTGVDFIAVNPGAPPCTEIIFAADLTCVCELGWKEYQRWMPPNHLLSSPPERQWHLVHSVPNSASLHIGKQASKKGALWTWATHGVLPDPWSAGREGR